MEHLLYAFLNLEVVLEIEENVVLLISFKLWGILGSDPVGGILEVLALEVVL